MSEHEQAVRDATRRYRQTEKAHERAREEVVSAVVRALEAGERPTDVTAWSPFTATYVRKLARAHGIEAPGRGSASGGAGERGSEMDADWTRTAGNAPG